MGDFEHMMFGQTVNMYTSQSARRALEMTQHFPKKTINGERNLSIKESQQEKHSTQQPVDVDLPDDLNHIDMSDDLVLPNGLDLPHVVSLYDINCDNDGFDFVKKINDQSSVSVFDDIDCSLEMDDKRSFGKSDWADSLLTDAIDDQLIVDLKKKEGIYKKIHFGKELKETNGKADLEYDQPEKTCHITYENIDFPNKKAVYQDDNSSPNNTVSVRQRDNLNNEDEKMAIDGGDPGLSGKLPISIEDFNCSDNNAHFGHCNDFVNRRKIFDGNSKVFDGNSQVFNVTSKVFDGHSKVCDGNSKVFDWNSKVFDGNSKVFDDHSKVFDCQDSSLMTRKKTFPAVSCTMVAKSSDSPPFSINQSNPETKVINFLYIMAAIKNRSLKKNDVMYIPIKGPDAKSPTRVFKETNGFRRKLAEPSGLGFPSTSGGSSGLDWLPFDSKLTEASTFQSKHAELLIGSHSPPKSGQSLMMSNNDNKNNPLIVDNVHKQVQSYTKSMHFAAKKALHCTSQDKTFKCQARGITNSKTNLATQVAKAPTSKVDQNIVSVQNCSNSLSHSSDYVKGNLQKKLKYKQEQNRQTSEYFNQETSHGDHPNKVHSKPLLPNLPAFKRKFESP